MEKDQQANQETALTAQIKWRIRLALVFLTVLAIASIWVTNRVLIDRFTETSRNQAELRLALYSGTLLSELRQTAIVPQLLARDPTLIGALNSGNFSQSTQRLISFVDEIGAETLTLLDAEGRVVASTDRTRLGSRHQDAPYYTQAMGADATMFNVYKDEVGAYNFIYSRRIESQGVTIGVIFVEADLQKYEHAWAGISDAVIVTDNTGVIILSTEPLWRGLGEAEALARQLPSGAIQRAIQTTSDWTAVPADAYLRGEGMMRVESRVAFRGWRMAGFRTYAGVRERVNGFLALEVMGFAVFLAFCFYYLSRQSVDRMQRFQQESADLRQLNLRLQREIAERERVQKTLEVAEQTIAQSSKLAALGQMSAAVSHELNQPLAAMKTYLAGARLLLGRNRPDEALVSFHRIDDLLERMGAITRQLKSYARKGGDSLVPVNLNSAIGAVLSMMELQLKQEAVHIIRRAPETPIWVLGDRVRIEQVLVNLLRNAIDATQGVVDPKIEIRLAGGEHATLTVRDNGYGVDDLDALFEPFYTTKQPGEGVGLGLAISSGIVTDLGGRLLVRNVEDGGALFEMQLPILADHIAAAE
ncbi:MAG: sensor histidine kinase [Marinovum sp.]|jgi:two-component system C4-dicarboxylate transport sensor histidine kinase DctB|nr:sensor histidine kinase [Marinovum sp.]MDG1789415.1 ATP-binding protein [Paracoccaceae bacterium]